MSTERWNELGGLTQTAAPVLPRGREIEEVLLRLDLLARFLLQVCGVWSVCVRASELMLEFQIFLEYGGIKGTFECKK